MVRVFRKLSDSVRGYLATPISGRMAYRHLLAVLAKAGFAVVIAIALIHAFAPQGLSFAELVVHGATLAVSFILGLLVAGWSIRLIVARRGAVWRAGNLWLISAVGFAIGLAIAASVELLPPLSRVASRAASVHGPGSMLPRLLPVWAILTAFIVRSEVLREYEQQFEALGGHLEHGAYPANWNDEVVISSGKNDLRFRHSAIICFHAEQNYCNVIVGGGETPKTVMVRSTLKSIVDSLPRSLFIKVHRSHVVNRHHVERIERRGRHFWIVAAGVPDPIPVSRRRVKQVMERIGG